MVKIQAHALLSFRSNESTPSSFVILSFVISMSILVQVYHSRTELQAYVALIPLFDVPEKETNLPIASFSTMKLPKGLTDDCDRPACDDTVSALTAALNRVQKQQQQQQETKSKETTTKECPPTSAQLGRSTWDLLHSMVRELCVVCAKKRLDLCIGGQTSSHVVSWR